MKVENSLSFGFLQKNLNKFNFELNRRDIFNNYSSKFYIFPELKHF